MSPSPKKHTPPKVPSERPGPEGGKRDVNRRRKVQMLCDISLDLFCEQGLESVSIDQLVAKAKVAKGSFYRYFRDKEELVATILLPLTTELRRVFLSTEKALLEIESPGGLSRAYAELGEAAAGLLSSNIKVLRLYLQENRGPAVGARCPIIRLAKDMDEVAQRLTLVARSRGLLRADSDARTCALTTLGAMERLLFSYVRGEDIGNPLFVSADLIRVILDGVRA